MIPRYQQGIEFNGSHSFRDLGLTVKSRTIGNPKKKKNLVQMPFTNQEYDLSEVYGLQTYENRQLTYILNVIDLPSNRKQEMNSLKIRALNTWVPANHRTILRDDAIPGYYFLAEIREAPAFTEHNGKGELTAVFDAYPFKISEKEQPDDLWDPFDFINDVAQNKEHKISGVTKVMVINLSATGVASKITVDTDMVLEKKGIKYNLKKGTNKDTGFTLDMGENNLTVTGNGVLSFSWFREVI